MDLVPKSSIKSFCLGDVLTGQDGNKYIVCDEAGIMYWKPHVAVVTNVTNVTVQVVTPSTKPTSTIPSKPIKKVKEVKEKYYWKDNDKKPVYDGDNWTEMNKSLKPNVSPTKFPAGYVWTTKFSDISYVVDTEYKGYSKTSSRFWRVVWVCPPCLDAEDYPYEYISDDGYYCVVYDEQSNKFWSERYGDGENLPLQQPYKFVEGTTLTLDGDEGCIWISCRNDDGSAWWNNVPQNNCDSDNDE